MPKLRLFNDVAQLRYIPPKIQTPEEQTMAFFRGLNVNGLHKLTKYWRQLPELALNPSDHSYVLLQTNKAIRQVHSDEMRDALQSYVIENFEMWSDNLATSMRYNSVVHGNQSLSGCMEIRIKPSEEVLYIAEEKLVDHLHDARPDNIAVRLSLFARMAHVPQDETLENIANTILHPRMRTNIPPGEFVTIYWAAAVFEALLGQRMEFADAVYEKLQPLYKRDAIRRRFNDGSPNSLAITGRMRNADLWFTGDDQGTINKTTNQVSPFENDTKEFFKIFNTYQLGRSGGDLPLLRKKSDHGFIVKGHHIHLENDGMTHFLIRQDDRFHVYDGETLFMTALAQKLYPKTSFIRLPIEDFYAAVDEHDPQHMAYMLYNLLHTVARSARHEGHGGTYVLSHQPGSDMYLNPL
ncbi:MAG TPA: hypothetical protein VIN59_05690 [Alphaproteobacteria bacterium]